MDATTPSVDELLNTRDRLQARITAIETAIRALVATASRCDEALMHIPEEIWDCISELESLLEPAK